MSYNIKYNINKIFNKEILFDSDLLKRGLVVAIAKTYLGTTNKTPYYSNYALIKTATSFSGAKFLEYVELRGLTTDINDNVVRRDRTSSIGLFNGELTPSKYKKELERFNCKILKYEYNEKTFKSPLFW